jgi:hypothetical protein
MLLRWLAFAAIGASLVLTSTAARADDPANDKAVCLASFVAAQNERRDAKLLAARASLVTCARDECPAEVRATCSKWLDEVDASLPTVVVAARTSDGRDRLDVKVTVDGGPFVESLDGRARPIDPGVHVFRFFAPGLAQVEERAAILEGQKNQKLIAVLPSPTATFEARPVPVASWVFGGLGVAGLSVFAIAGLSGRIGDSSLASLERCKPNCSVDEASRVHTKFLVADVGLVAGLVSLGVATVFYATRPTVRTSR